MKFFYKICHLQQKVGNSLENPFKSDSFTYQIWLNELLFAKKLDLFAKKPSLFAKVNHLFAKTSILFANPILSTINRGISLDFISGFKATDLLQASTILPQIRN